MNLPKIQGKTYTYQAWPSWAYGPNGESAIFESEAEIPKGWTTDRKAKTKAPAPAPAAPAPKKVAEPVVTAEDGAPEVDAAGIAWNPDLHAATKSKTKAGLWRMKVGVARPEGHSAPLDL